MKIDSTSSSKPPDPKEVEHPTPKARREASEQEDSKAEKTPPPQKDHKVDRTA